MQGNFKLIVITSESSIANESDLINRLFEAGMPLLHVRKTGYDIHEMQRLLNSISDVFHQSIVIHSHYGLLQEFSLKGIHLPEKVRRYESIERTGKIISTSFHTIEDMRNENQSFEYAFLSPVFSSISKRGYQPSLNPQQIKSLLSHPVLFPVIALGGITPENISQVQEMGFSGVASIGYIWDSNDPVEQFNKLKKVATNY